MISKLIPKFSLVVMFLMQSSFLATAALSVHSIAEHDLFILGGNQTVGLDIDNDGQDDVSWSTGAAGSAILSINDRFKLVIVLSPPPNIGGAAAALPQGYEIGSILSSEAYEVGSLGTFSFNHEFFISDPVNGVNPFYSVPIQFCFSSGCSGYFAGQDAYIGFSFEEEDGIHYGWFEVEGTGPQNSGDGVNRGGFPGGNITRIVYETEAGVPVITGVVPEPSSVFLLLGSGLLAVFRKKRR